MITCPKCSKELEDGTKFCDNCGTQIFEVVFCPNCGEQTSSEYAFCQKCGASIAEPPSAPAEPTQKKKAVPKKALLFGGIGVAAVAVIAFVAALLAGGGKQSNYALYLKDKEIVYTNFSDKGPMEISSRLLNGSSVSSSDLAYYRSDIGSYVALNDKGTRIFYPDRIDSGSDGVTLYYRNLKKPEEDPVKIDSDVTRYAINSDGSQVVYLKGRDGILYLHDLTDKNKIASGVSFFVVSEDFKKIGYFKDENSWYTMRIGKDPEKLAGDISSVQHVSDDLSTLYFVRDGSLYKQVEGSEDREKIVTDFSRIISIYDSGEIYYTKSHSSEKRLIDYVNDDLAASDAALTEPAYPDYPNYPEYPYWWDYDTVEAYDAAVAQYERAYAEYEATYDRLYQEYYDAYERYWAKESRDYLREGLQNATIDTTEYTLYYFDGKEETVVTDALVDDWSVTAASERPVATVLIYNESDMQKVKLSEIDYLDEVRSQVYTSLYSSSEAYVAAGSSLSVIDQTDAYSFTVASDGSAVYFLDDVSADNYGDLYKITVKNGQAGKPEMLDSDVSIFFMELSSEDELFYYKNIDFDAWKGDLCVNGVEIDYDVRPYWVSHFNDALLYYTDWSDDHAYGTLKMSKNGTKTKIADDVHDFDLTGSGDILYLYDYSTNHYTGTLYSYNKGNPKKIDDDVVALIPVADRPIIRGGYIYGW